MQQLNSAPSSSYAPGAMGTNSYTDPNAGYNCPGSPNVTPDSDTNLDGTDYFTVCTSKTADDNLLVHGSTEHSGTICVIPVMGSDDQNMQPVADPSSHQLLMQCVSASSSGASVSFSSAQFNGVLIVESQDANGMISCMYSGDYNTCPNYSFGMIR
jgi:hypothetical protein